MESIERFKGGDFPLLPISHCAHLPLASLDKRDNWGGVSGVKEINMGRLYF